MKKNLFKNFIKNTKNTLLSFFDFNKKRDKNEYILLKNIRKQKIPCVRQIFCITKIFSEKERKIFLIAFWIFIISLIWSFNSISNKYKIEIPKVYGEYIEGELGSPQHINSIFASLNEVDQDICSLVYSGLLKYDEKRDLITDLAVKYVINEENTEYTFELKKDILWHDGEKFTADDIVFTFDLIQEESVASPLQITFKNINVVKIDDYTIKFILEQASSSFLSSLTVGILPSHIWNLIPYEQIKLAQRNLQPIGTGPFKFDKLVKDEFGFIHRIELVRNEDYYKNPSYLKKITFEFFSDYDGPNGLVSALREQKINGISFVPYEYREKIERKHIVLNTLQLPQYTALFLNQNRINDIDLKTALSKSLDKERIIKEVLENEAKVIEGPILESYPGYSEIKNKNIFLISEANEILDEKWSRITASDYRELLKKEKVDYLLKEAEKNNENQILEEAEEKKEEERGENISPDSNSNEESAQSGSVLDGENVSSTIDIEKINEDVENELNSNLDPAQIFYRYKESSEDKKNVLELNLVTVASPEYTKVAQIVSGYWQDIGIKVNLKFIDPQDITKEILKTRDYDIFLYGVLLGNDPDQYPFWHSDQIDYPGLNLSAYSNEDVDTILEDIRKNEKPENLDEMYKQLQDTILEDIPAIFLYTPTYTYAQEDIIKGFDIERISEPSDRFSNITNWFIKTKKVWKEK